MKWFGGGRGQKKGEIFIMSRRKILILWALFWNENQWQLKIVGDYLWRPEDPRGEHQFHLNKIFLSFLARKRTHISNNPAQEFIVIVWMKDVPTTYQSETVQNMWT